MAFSMSNTVDAASSMHRVMQRPLFGAYDTLLKELCFAEEKGYTKNPRTFDKSFSFIEPCSL